jgi:hypothetical protein
MLIQCIVEEPYKLEEMVEKLKKHHRIFFAILKFSLMYSIVFRGIWGLSANRKFDVQTTKITFFILFFVR